MTKALLITFILAGCGCPENLTCYTYDDGQTNCYQCGSD